MNNLKIQGNQKKSVFRFLLKPLLSAVDNCKVKKWERKIILNAQTDGHPVVIIPGYIEGDRSVNLLNRFLKKNKYNSEIWPLAIEVGEGKNFHYLSEKVEMLYEQTGKPISLIGWSLGGLYARLLAKKHPNKIRQLISLSAPFNGANFLDNAEWWFSLVYGGTKFASFSTGFWKKMSEPVLVPTTAIYSKDDTLVSWKTCIEKIEDDWHQNVEIKGGHIDVLFNHEILVILLDRLAHNKESWQKFKRVNWLPLPLGKVI